MSKELTKEELEELIIDKSISKNEIIHKGIYFLIRNKEIIYIGQSANIYKRIFAQIEQGKKFDSVAIQFMPNEKKQERRELERNYILILQPKENNIRWERLSLIPYSIRIIIEEKQKGLDYQLWYNDNLQSAVNETRNYCELLPN